MQFLQLFREVSRFRSVRPIAFPIPCFPLIQDPGERFTVGPGTINFSLVCILKHLFYVYLQHFWFFKLFICIFYNIVCKRNISNANKNT